VKPIILLITAGLGEVKDDLEEKEAIEREITRRGVTDYHWPPWVTYRYVHDIATANIGLLPCPSKGQLHQARRQLHRKRESQHSIEQLAIQVAGNVAVDYYRINATWANGEGAEVRNRQVANHAHMDSQGRHVADHRRHVLACERGG
jgi:hypothetical protein